MIGFCGGLCVGLAVYFSWGPEKSVASFAIKTLLLFGGLSLIVLALSN